jgi:hypothetical protein
MGEKIQRDRISPATEAGVNRKYADESALGEQ